MNLRKESLIRAAFVILVATFTSRVLGFAREILIAHFFGARAITDSYLVATVLPSTLAGLVSGALTTVFIPLFIEEREGQGEEKAWEGARVVLRASLVYLVAATFVSYLLLPYFVRAIAPGFRGERLALSLSMGYLMMPSLLFLGLLGLLTGIMNAYQAFTLPALAGLLYNTCLISFLWWARCYPVLSLSLGHMLGVLGQFLILFFALRKRKPFGGRWSFSHPILVRTWKLMLPVLVGTGVGYLNLVVDRVFASLLPVGTIAALNFAFRVREIPTGLFGSAISQAVYPSTSLQVTRGKIEELRDLFSRSLEGLLLFILPATAGLLILPRETIKILFERGAFDPHATGVTAQALFFYALGLPASASLQIVGQVFYAFQDTATPVKVGIIGLAMNIGLNALLVRSMAHRGLALATSLSAIFIFLVLFEILRRRLGGIGGRELLRNLKKIALATVCMAAFLLVVRPYAHGWAGYLSVAGVAAAFYGAIILFLRPRSGEKVVEVGKRVVGFLFRRK